MHRPPPPKTRTCSSGAEQDAGPRRAVLCVAPMAIFLAPSSAAAYGIGAFCGGLATRRASAAAVVLWSHVLGLALLFGAAMLLSRDAALGSASRRARVVQYSFVQVGPGGTN